MNPEDLRPRTLSEIVGQADAVKLLKGLADRTKSGGITPPHLLFYGPPGCGKTTAAHAFARELFGEAYPDNFREMNASEERGIKVVQEQISSFVGYSPNGDAPFKILFLDEADSMTPDAQHALRRMMETGSETTLFILAGNHVSKIIEAIRSRTLAIAFKPLPDDAIRTVVSNAARQANLPAPSEAMLGTIVLHSRGLARNAVVLTLGGEEGGKLLQLDQRIVELFRPSNGSTNLPVSERVESFVGYVRGEGVGDYEDLLESIYILARSKKLLPDERAIRRLAELTATTAYRSTQVALPLTQLRYALIEALS